MIISKLVMSLCNCQLKLIFVSSMEQSDQVNFKMYCFLTRVEFKYYVDLVKESAVLTIP